MFKRNQVMITALAIMIAVAGYLNFAGTKVGEEELADVGASAGQESDMEALLELSDEDGKEDIASLDSDTEDVAAENFLNENMQTISDQDVAALTDDAADSAEEALDAEVQEGEIPGEAVYTNSGSVSSLSGARLLKEQTRAKNKETLLEIINNANIAENQKQEAVDEMIALTDLTERETAAEILLETRGYADAVVTITDESADVVVGMSVGRAVCADRGHRGAQDRNRRAEYRHQSTLPVGEEQNALSQAEKAALLRLFRIPKRNACQTEENMIH